MEIKTLANILHNCGLNAVTHPHSRDSASWNEYRETIALRILENWNVVPTEPGAVADNDREVK